MFVALNRANELVKWIAKIFRMNVSGFGPLNWVAGKSVTNVIQETVLQVRTLLRQCYILYNIYLGCRGSFESWVVDGTT